MVEEGWKRGEEGRRGGIIQIHVYWCQVGSWKGNNLNFLFSKADYVSKVFKKSSITR